MEIEDADTELEKLAQRLVELAASKELTIVTAESCTAGMLSAAFSRAAGAGRHFHGGIVAYSKAMKARLLGVDPDLMKLKTTVCDEVAVAMARGSLRATPADIAIAITGVAGPEPDEDGNPVGLMCVAIAFARRETVHWQKCYPNHGPAEILWTVMMDAMKRLLGLLEDERSAA